MKYLVFVVEGYFRRNLFYWLFSPLLESLLPEDGRLEHVLENWGGILLNTAYLVLVGEGDDVASDLIVGVANLVQIISDLDGLILAVAS